MKAIMIADKPIWCAKIMNRNKLIEVRRNKALYKATMKLIEEHGYATFFMYCSKDDKKHLYPAKLLNNHNQICKTIYEESKIDKRTNYLNGKIVAKFTVRKVEEIEKYTYPNYYGEDVCDDDDFYYLESQPLSERKYDGLRKTTCLSEEELYEYLDDKQGYAYHIEDLVIFDEPKELSEFKHCTEKTCIYRKCHKYMHCLKPLTKAPQNFCYVESEE